MHAVTSRSFQVLVAVAALLSAAACKSSSDDKQPGNFPVGAGIVQNAGLSSLEGLGWRVCFEDGYGDFGTSIASILESCTGTYMMLGCRANGTSDTLVLAAADLRSVVTQPDSSGPTDHHVSNGVGWYFSDTLSWGFFPAGSTLNRASCDDFRGDASKDKRLCWHADSGNLQNGFRCGDNDLSAPSAWRRIVLVK
jgi:hypothetical protein